MIELIPITTTVVDWDTLLRATKAILNRSLSEQLDTRKIKVGDLSSYIMALGEFELEGTDPNKLMSEPGSLLRHVQSGFLVVGPRHLFFELLSASDLKITTTDMGSDNCCAVITGNLEEWRMAIINGCSPNTSFNLRLLFDKAIVYFEKAGLGKLWSNYQKINMSDKTFKLIEKK